MNTAIDFLMEALSRTQYLTFEQACEVTEAAIRVGGMEQILPVLPINTDARGVRQVCNTTTRQILDLLHQQQRIAVVNRKDVDCGRVLPRYEGNAGIYIGNVINRDPPNDEVADAVSSDLRRTRPQPCDQFPFFTLPGNDDQLYELHQVGRSEFLTNVATGTSFYCALKNSAEECLRRCADSFQRLPWPARLEELGNVYACDAEITLKDRVFRVCSCYYADCHRGVAAARPALDTLHRRLDGHPYLLLSARGYSMFARNRKRLPKGVIKYEQFASELADF